MIISSSSSLFLLPLNSPRMSEMSADCPNSFPCPSVWCRLVTCHVSRVTQPAHDIPGVVYSGQSVTKWFVFVECKNLLTATRHVSSSSRTRGGGGGSGIKIISQDLHTERVWTLYLLFIFFYISFRSYDTQEQMPNERQGSAHADKMLPKC